MSLWCPCDWKLSQAHLPHFWTLAFISHRSALHQASAQPCYLLPTLSPGFFPGAHLCRVPSRTRQPAPADRAGHPPAPGTPPAPHCPAHTPSVPGCAGAPIPTSGLTPAIPHPAAASRSAAPQDPATLQVNLQLNANAGASTRCSIFKSLCFCRRTQERIPLNPHRLRSGYEYTPPLHVPQPMTQQPRYLAEGTDWWVTVGRSMRVLQSWDILCTHSSAWVWWVTSDIVVGLSSCRDLSVDAGLPHHQYQLQQLPQHYQHYLASPRMHHFPRNTSSAQVVCWLFFIMFTITRIFK